ncbi:hypothetical protein RZS08_00335 [Arthrospira platensis SPKY1]|nr:hypothetical protein [Arthrospira platensis SPKY1]
MLNSKTSPKTSINRTIVTKIGQGLYGEGEAEKLQNKKHSIRVGQRGSECKSFTHKAAVKGQKSKIN